MSDEDLIGYLFDLLDPNDRAAVAERAATDPTVGARLERLRGDAAALLALAEIERQDPPAPPPGLAVRAIARVAQYVVENEPRVPEPAESESPVAAIIRDYTDEPPEIDILFGPGTRAPTPAADRDAPLPAAPPLDGPDYRAVGHLRTELLVAACIAFVGVGLLLSGIAKARHEQRMAACQNSLHTLYNGLTEYANQAGGRYPQVGTPTVPTADAFAAALVESGHFQNGYKPGCPATPDCPAYTYTLGFRNPNGDVVGLRRPGERDDSATGNDSMPISADLPAASVAPVAGPVSPHGRAMNVLFVDGHVCRTTDPHVGPGGDDIYRNMHGYVAAGANRNDAVLGRTGDKP